MTQTRRPESSIHSVLLDEAPFTLESGAVLPEVRIAYNTFGTLNQKRSNAVLVAHALTGSSSCDEWWSGLVGEGRILDPRKYFIICANALGSCYGSTGPQSLNPRTGEAYGGTFPIVTIGDIARSQLGLLNKLGISELHLAIGGSMGGMVALELAVQNKETVSPIDIRHLAIVAASAEHSAWRVAFSSTIRRTIEQFAALVPKGGLEEGLRIARQFGMISYRSSEEFDARFGRLRSADHKQFEVERYLEHQSDNIVKRFSPQCYIILTRAMELFDVTKGRDGSIEKILAAIDSRTLLVGISSDVLYSTAEIESLSRLIPRCEYRTLRAPYGHDSFIVAAAELGRIVSSFLDETQSDETLVLAHVEDSVYA